MRLKYRLSLAVISILMVMTLFLSSSYALWSVTVTQQTENVIKSGCFSIAFENEGNSSSINLTNTYPMSDEKGSKLTPYKFKIKNTCTVDAKYTLYLSELETESKASATTTDSEHQNLSDYIKISLSKGNNGAVITKQKLGDTKTSTSEKDLVKKVTVNDLKFDGKTIKNTYQLTSGTLKGKTGENAANGGEESFELHLWIDENANNTVMDQVFEAGLSVVAYATDLSQTTQSNQES